MIAAGLDPGARWASLAVAAVGGAVPLVELSARTYPVDDAALDAALAIVADIEAAGAQRLTIEWGPYYCRPYPGESKSAFLKRDAASQKYREVQVKLKTLIEAGCRVLKIPVDVIAVSRARSLIGALGADGARGRVDDKAARCALVRMLGAELVDKVERDTIVFEGRRTDPKHDLDAVAVLLAATLAPPKVEGEHLSKREQTEGQIARRRKRNRDAINDKRNRDRVACGMAPVEYAEQPKPYRLTPVNIDGVVATMRAHAERLGVTYAALKQRRHLRMVPPRVAGVRACGKCGGPVKGHVRGLPCPPAATAQM